MDRAAVLAVGIAILGFPLISSTGAEAHMHHSMGMGHTTPVGTVSAPKAAARTSVAQSRTSIALPKKARAMPAPASKPAAAPAAPQRPPRLNHDWAPSRWSSFLVRRERPDQFHSDDRRVFPEEWVTSTMKEFAAYYPGV